MSIAMVKIVELYKRDRPQGDIFYFKLQLTIINLVWGNRVLPGATPYSDPNVIVPREIVKNRRFLTGLAEVSVK
tara:strand:- start:65 stop:286 length:222 start_codon:yes stop_codon:yes gene_type:complete